MSSLKSIAIVPARFESTRFPGKPLVTIAQKTMIQHVYERSLQAKSVSEVIVATDDRRILQAVQAFGGQVRMTSPLHRSGTDRVAEVAAASDAASCGSSMTRPSFGGVSSSEAPLYLVVITGNPHASDSSATSEHGS